VPDLYVDGEWVSARSGATRTIRCPADGTEVRVVDEAGPEDTEAAIAAAYAAFHDGPWRHTSAGERGDLLLRVADLLERDVADVARAESLDTGKRLVEGEYDVADVASVFRYYGRVAAEDAGRVVDTGNADVVSRIVHEPVGVCGLIAPWNYPLLQASWKVAPCLAAGNTFVLKPSELTPSTSIHLMRILEEAGLPKGVGNLVLGAGPEAGAPLASDPRVDLVSFTGGLQTGRAIMAAAAPTVKKIALELGGKNPNIVFADADLGAGAQHEVRDAGRYAGLLKSAHQQDRRGRRELAGLEHEGVAGQQRGRHLPGGLQQRVVPRRDQPADPDRLVHHGADGVLAAGVDRPAGVRAGDARVVEEAAGDVLDVVLALDQPLPGVEGLGLRVLLLVPQQQVGDPAEHRPALDLGGARPGPLVEGSAGGCDGALGVDPACLAHARDQAAVRGTADLPPVAALGVDPRSVHVEVCQLLPPSGRVGRAGA